MTSACARITFTSMAVSGSSIGMSRQEEEPDRMDPLTTRPETTIERIARGEQGAVAACYDAFAHVAWSTIRGLSIDEHAAREVMQDVFVAVWRQASQYDPTRSSEATWICRLARARAIDRLRHERAARRGGGIDAANLEEAWSLADADDTERIFARDTVRATLREALRELPAQQRVLIELTFLSGYTHAELSERLGIPIGTIKTRIFRGLDYLRRKLDPAIHLEDLS